MCACVRMCLCVCLCGFACVCVRVWVCVREQSSIPLNMRVSTVVCNSINVSDNITIIKHQYYNYQTPEASFEVIKSLATWIPEKLQGFYCYALSLTPCLPLYLSYPLSCSLTRAHSLSLSLFLSFPLSLYLFPSLCLSLSLSLSLTPSLSPSFHLSLSPALSFVCTRSIFHSFSLSFFYLSLGLCLFICLSLSANL